MRSSKSELCVYFNQEIPSARADVALTFVFGQAEEKVAVEEKAAQRRLRVKEVYDRTRSLQTELDLDKEGDDDDHEVGGAHEVARVRRSFL